MHNTLRKLIFGLDEFEKVRIDDRFKQIDSILDNISLEKREDFEILEECLYKIKEQLRIKSSNLNKTISDGSNDLKKSDVNRILEKLEQIKYEFIGMAFDNIQKKEVKVEEKTVEKVEEKPIVKEIPKKEPEPKPIVKEEPIPMPKAKEEEEDSLDSLLSNINEPKKEVEENPVEKEEPQPVPKEEPKTVVKEEPKEQAPKIDIPSLPYEIYRDENIIAYFEKNSIAKGELVIKPFSDKKMKDLDESQISYITIFSKVFASILFELTNSQGTNLFWDYKSDCVRIVPRFENDGIDFKMMSEKTTEEFLDQIRERIINDMGKKSEEKIEEPIKDPNVEAVEGQLMEPVKKEIPKLTSDSKERSDFLINKLKRMP